MDKTYVKPHRRRNKEKDGTHKVKGHTRNLNRKKRDRPDMVGGSGQDEIPTSGERICNECKGIIDLSDENRGVVMKKNYKRNTYYDLSCYKRREKQRLEKHYEKNLVFDYSDEDLDEYAEEILEQDLEDGFIEVRRGDR